MNQTMQSERLPINALNLTVRPCTRLAGEASPRASLLGRILPGRMVHDDHAIPARTRRSFAAMLRRHRGFLLNWFRAKGQISAGVVEGFNNKAKLTTRK